LDRDVVGFEEGNGQVFEVLVLEPDITAGNCSRIVSV
jgi:hypothetical protein